MFRNNKLKPKIALVCDIPNWAYHNIAKFIESELSAEYDFDIIFAANYPRSIKGYARKLINWFQYGRKINHKNVKYDICVFFWWKSKNLIKGINSQNTIVGIFTEGWPIGNSKELSGLSKEDFINTYIGKNNSIVAGNQSIYNDFKNHHERVYFATGAADLNTMQYSERDINKKKFVVGWCGNPHRSFKGFKDFVLPLEDMFSDQTEVEFKYRFSGPYKSLPNFYREIDVLVNPSTHDAGPSFVVDGGLCGVPTISVAAGIANEVIKPNINGVICNRSLEEFYDAIMLLKDNKNMLAQMRRQISSDLREIANPKARADLWREMFSDILSEVH